MRQVFLCTMLAAAAAAQPGPAVKKDRSLGYDDTPFLPGQPWRVHDVSRPRPPMVRPPGPASAPSDAVVLFDDSGLSRWTHAGGGEAAWKVADGYFEVVPKTGHLVSRDKFGDCQLHIEWATPDEIRGKSQSRGNSGVMLMGRYEIQVLDSSADNPTYADGQAASIYAQWPPLVNASRGPGEWQAYDVFFEAPRFDGEKLVKPAYVTVVHNGVLVHHHKELSGRMTHARVGTYAPHEAEEPLMLQNHGSPVRYRNIWIRRLNGYDTAK